MQGPVGRTKVRTRPLMRVSLRARPKAAKFPHFNGMQGFVEDREGLLPTVLESLLPEHWSPSWSRGMCSIDQVVPQLPPAQAGEEQTTSRRGIEPVSISRVEDQSIRKSNHRQCPTRYQIPDVAAVKIGHVLSIERHAHRRPTRDISGEPLCGIVCRIVVEDDVLRRGVEARDDQEPYRNCEQPATVGPACHPNNPRQKPSSEERGAWQRRDEKPVVNKEDDADETSILRNGRGK